MNFMVAFVLEVSGLKELETFDFLVQLLKSPSKMFIGLYEQDFPMVSFLTFLFYKALQSLDQKRYNQVLSCGVPNELWLVKWFLTLFSGYLEKHFLLRVWDFLVVEDFLGPVYVALSIVLLSGGLFVSFEQTIISLKDSKTLCEQIDFRSFIKNLQKMKLSTSTKRTLLREYYKDLKGQANKDFAEIHDRLLMYLNRRESQERECNYIYDVSILCLL